MHLLWQRAWSCVNHTFPERQIYIRSDGRVQFFSFSSQMQAIFAGVGLLFFGWVAFTSVNVIFKDRILAAKERHFEQMQVSYESRIADLQLSYDELNSALVVAQDRFQAIADSFEARQQVLAAVVEHKKALQASLGIGTPSTANALNATPAALPAFSTAAGIGGVFDALSSNSAAVTPPPFATDLRPEQSSSTASPDLKPAARADVARTPERPTFFKGAISKLGALFHRSISENVFNHPILKQANAQSARIVRLEPEESTLLAEATQDVTKETARLSRALKATGIDTNSLMTRVAKSHASGGPLIPIEPSSDGSDDIFGTGLSEASIAVEKLHDVVTALNAVPLLSPTEFGSVSSGFGARLDPFNEQAAFHSGIDFSGPKGSAVRATAAGVVVFTGKQGDYGNTVEVDHGYGVRTRYGHLAKIQAQVGTRLEKGAVVGTLGSTGRSTGPHVHYEIWYDQAVRDPGRFIKAGRDVLQE